MLECTQEGITRSTQVYCETLKNPDRVIQNKRCETVIPSVMLLHDSACLCRATCTKLLLEHFNWDLFEF
jgi:hypothetical protein